MAYTKYSLTPANNTAAPPDGAPEGMLPSAVNDTMRDMMAQIRDVGDGIRGGTYTMTAPVITGGTITGVALTGNTFTSPVITGGSINNTPIGATTANTGAFTTVSASGVATFSAGTSSDPAITTTGDTNTGVFFPAADTIAFVEGGTESLRLLSTGAVSFGSSGTAYGTAGQVLTSNGNAAPSFQNAAASGGAVAWVQALGGTGSPLTINGSLNVSSITRTNVGRYVVNFTNNLANINYSVVASSSITQSQGIFAVPFYTAAGTISAPTVSSFPIIYLGTNGAPFDVDYVNLAVFN